MLILTLLIISISLPNLSSCEEVTSIEPSSLGDARIIMPIVKLSRGLINLATKGQPMQIDFGKSEVAQSIGLLAWRTKLQLPKGIIAKTQAYFNDIYNRVSESSVSELERKSLEQIGNDMIEILDTVVEHVRTSPKGIYSDITEAQVEEGKQLDEAMTNVGLQFKAYKTDLMMYRDIAHRVLGIPVMPAVAARLVAMIKAANATTPSVLKNPAIQITDTANQALSILSKSVSDVGKNIASYPTALFNTNAMNQPLTA